MESIRVEGLRAVSEQGEGDIIIDINFTLPVSWYGRANLQFDPVEQKFTLILREVELGNPVGNRVVLSIPEPMITNGDHPAVTEPIPSPASGGISPRDLSRN